jgi:hypothetical protein
MTVVAASSSSSSAMSTTTTLVYTISALLLIIAVGLAFTKQAPLGAFAAVVAAVTLAVSMGVSGGEEEEQDVVVYAQKPARSSKARMNRFVNFQPGAAQNAWTPQVNRPMAIADVTNNAYVGYESVYPDPTYLQPAPSCVAPCQESLLLPVHMEGRVQPRVDAMRDNAPACGAAYKIVPNLPPMPGMVQYSAESVWRLPEYPVDQPSREESIAAVVPGLPTCCQSTPKEVIRNQGLYGIRGNLSCAKMQRSAVADRGFLEPLHARNSFLAYEAYDQLHAKDQWLIPVIKKQPE